MSDWIDFKALRSQLDFERVLRLYGVEVKRKGDQHHGFCPLPNHQGKKNSPSFSANLKRGIFQCFGCGGKGNVIDFAVLMEQLNPDDGADVRKAAVMLREKFGLSAGTTKRQAAPQPESPAIRETKAETSVVANAPLDFELKRLDPNHPYLDRRGFTAETIRHFGLGFCAKGFLAGRVAIPLHNQTGQLVGYAGRIADGTPIGEKCPKYLFPSGRERAGIIHEFRKLMLLYNGHRITGPVDDLIVVEGFPSIWWLFQMGFPNAVALMGWVCSEEQAKIITGLVRPAGRVWLIPDGDESGERCAVSLLPQIAQHRSVRLLKLDEGKQPTDYPGGYFRERFK